MILVASALSLLVVYAGMKLLALTKKDTLGNAYKAISWVIIIMGFLILLCAAAHGIMHHRANCMKQTEMRGDGYGHRGMDRMRFWHGGMMRDGHDGMMGDGSRSWDKMGDGHDGMKDGGHMHDGMMRSDSSATKK